MNIRKHLHWILLAAATVVLAVVILNHPRFHYPSPTEDEGVPVFVENTTNRLKVLLFCHPSDYFLYKGTVIGFQYELLRLMADSLHKELDLTFTSEPEDVQKDLLTSTYDIIAYDLLPSQPGYKYLEFSETHSMVYPVLLKNKNVENEAVRKVWIPQHFPCEIVPDSLPTAQGWQLVKDTLDAESLLELLQDDSIGYVVVDNITAFMLEPFYANVQTVKSVGADFERRWILNPANATFNKQLNEWLLSFKKTRQYDRFCNKYFHPQSRFLLNASPEKKRGRISAYDATIRRLSDKRGVDWRFVSSIIYQESHFSPHLYGYGGAYGIMQMMPPTARAYGIDSTSSVTEQLAAGVKMIAYTNKMFKSIEDDNERVYFVAAAYNSGAGHIFDARALCRKYGGNPDVWLDVEPYLIKKSIRKYYSDPVVKCGYYPGKHTANYAHDVVERYHAYRMSMK